MSILSGFFKTKRYRKTTDGYKLESNWTSGNTVELDDGNTVQNNLGAIKGITTSTSVTEQGYAADATTVAAINNSLGSYQTAWTKAYQSKINLCQNASGTISLSDSIYNYEEIQIENSNYGMITVSVPSSNNILRVSTISMSGSIMVLCCASWTISNDGKILNPSYMVQANIQSSGVTYFNTSASLTWNINGLSHKL